MSTRCLGRLIKRVPHNNVRSPGSQTLKEESLLLVDSAVVWDLSAKHARGQKVKSDHRLEDEDIIHIAKEGSRFIGV
ncbi:hypothetical protein M405DRAFT_864794 [Rhizopogon salebrosus TDB-379]|nr:hypothetical protein M405DRAFT_864794 [Rhizopogon salebrosus TDB-379]